MHAVGNGQCCNTHVLLVLQATATRNPYSWAYKHGEPANNSVAVDALPYNTNWYIRFGVITPVAGVYSWGVKYNSPLGGNPEEQRVFSGSG